MYHLFFRLLFQRMDPEQAHHLAFGWIRRVARIPGLRALVRALLAPRHPELRVSALGLEHSGPFGLAAGFDKNAVGIDGMAMLGFDHVEIGTVTAQQQPGNPRKRLFRLVEDRALINRMGFNNDGSAAVAARLAARTPVFNPVIGVNIGKTKVVPEAEAVADYVTSTERLAAYADYLVVNVSSPNTPGLRNLQAVDQLRPLLSAVREAADHTVTTRRVPLLVKIAPDLADEDIDAVADLALELGLDGIIATNTTIAREELGLRTDRSTLEAIGAGGLSGAPLRARSLEMLRRLYARVGDRITLIGVGGIETADDVWERILAGASLVQGYSAFIYQGPLWCRAIHRGLAAHLKSGPYATLADAVGAAARQESS
ncbi:MAG: quinone-dependent dihydroorotate dehydrogenase [Streptomycetaceae bacterium]|nr:quinone-dependent dihydroorotate dehydrogenase [Streptomycetaceae bacterium]